MYRIFLVCVPLMMACGIDEPWSTTFDSLDSFDPPSTEPVMADFCFNFDPPPWQVPLEVFEKLCLDYPLSWGGCCEANSKIQPCLEFLQGLVDSCGHEQDSCSYRSCSLALQQAPCGEWPEECITVAKCETPPMPVPSDSPTSSGGDNDDICSTGGSDGDSTSDATGPGSTGLVEN